MDKLRRDLLQDLLSVGGTAFVNPYSDSTGLEVLERLARSLQKPSELNETMLSHLETITKTQWQLHTHSEDAASYRRNMLHGVSGQLHTLAQLLEHPLQTPTHNRLSSLVSEATQLLGEIFLFDIGNHSKAVRYYDAALVAANEAQRDVLFAVTLGRKSFVYLYGGNSAQALLFLQAAHQVAEKCASDIIRAWLFAAEAEAQANLHNSSACLSALEKAEFFLDRAQQKDISYSFERDLSFSLFSPSMLLGYKGVCYMRLKKTEEAQNILKQDLSVMQPERIIHKSVTYIDLAMTYIQQGEVEETCKCLEQALTLIEQTKSAKTLQRVLSSRQELDLWKDTVSVKRLDAHLATVIATGTF